MTRSVLALSIAGLIALSGCTPAPTVATPANQAIPAASGILRVAPAVTEGEPPTLVLEPPSEMTRLSPDDDEDTTIYEVIINEEELYSLWPSHRELPPGWRKAGKQGLKRECLDYIQKVWTDMRPLSLRKKMEEAAARQK